MLPYPVQPLDPAAHDSVDDSHLDRQNTKIAHLVSIVASPHNCLTLPPTQQAAWTQLHSLNLALQHQEMQGFRTFKHRSQFFTHDAMAERLQIMRAMIDRMNSLMEATEKAGNRVASEQHKVAIDRCLFEVTEIETSYHQFLHQAQANFIRTTKFEPLMHVKMMIDQLLVILNGHKSDQPHQYIMKFLFPILPRSAQESLAAEVEWVGSWFSAAIVRFRFFHELPRSFTVCLNEKLVLEPEMKIYFETYGITITEGSDGNPFHQLGFNHKLYLSSLQL